MAKKKKEVEKKSKKVENSKVEVGDTLQRIRDNQPPKDSDAWFKQGSDGFAESKKQAIARKLKFEKGIRRLYMKSGEEKTVVFVDSKPFFVDEHNLKIGKFYGNFATCTKAYKPCPICGDGKNSVFTGYLTIIDTTEYTNQTTGKVTKNQKVLIPLKGSAIAVVEKLIEEYGNLAGLAFKISRLSDKDPNCGRDFKLVSKNRQDIGKKLGAEFAQSHDYRKILAPPTEEELVGLGFSSNIVGSLADTDDIDNSDSTDNSSDNISDIF